MAATEHLNTQQFMGVEELKNTRSGDFGGKVGDMKSKWLADANQPEDATLGHSGPQRRHTEHGGPQGYVDHLAASIQKHGMQQPLTVAHWDSSEGPQQTLLEGHHRALAALQLGMPKIPVNHTTYDRFFNGH